MLEDLKTRQCKEILRKHKLNPIKKLGKGAFGEVYLVSQTDCTSYKTQLFSVKCTNKRTFIKKPALRRYLKQQINLMEALEHENIVRLLRTFQDSGWIFMLMEYCDMGNLAHLQSQKPNKIYELVEAKSIVMSIIEGLQYMHSHNIIHRDIKPQNILQTKCQETGKVTVKICDLGFARQTENSAETVCGTTYYMAPQIHYKNKYDFKVDVWALGVLFFKMLFGVQPFKSLNMISQIQNKCSKQGFDLDSSKLPENKSISVYQFEQLRLLFKKIFQIDPQNRITILNLKKEICSMDSCTVALTKNSYKNTLDSEGEEEEEKDDTSEEQMPQFHIQEIQFIQAIKREVCELEFLNQVQEFALKYYLDKVCLSIFLANDNLNYKAYKHLSTSLINEFKNTQNIDSVFLTSKLSKLNIKKVKQAITLNNSTNFQNYKQAYRLILGHIFSNAHKKLQDTKLKNQIKLKILCCHVINRVFESNHLQQLFAHFFNWIHKHKKQPVFCLPALQQWICQESPQKIMETIQKINNKFYKRNK